MSIDKAIIGVAALNAGGIVGGLGLGWLVDRIGPTKVLCISYASAALFVGLIGAISTKPVPLVMLTVFLAGVFVIGSQFCMNALAANYYPTSIRSTGVGWALGVGRIGSVIGPVVGGLIIALGWSTRRALRTRVAGFDVVHFYTQNAALLSGDILRTHPSVVSTDSTNALNAYRLPYRKPTVWTPRVLRLTQRFERRVYDAATLVIANSGFAPRSCPIVVVRSDAPGAEQNDPAP